MPLTELGSFTFSTDLHLLRGEPQPAVRLSTMLSVTWGTGSGQSGTLADYLNLPNHPQDVAVEFRPLFHVNDTGDALENADFGISLKKTTGEINLAHDSPLEPAPHNFIVEATVVRNDLGPAPESFKARILRVHVHQSVVRIWPTPEKLSLRRSSLTGPSQTTYSFTVRAEFDDGVVADITRSDRYAPIPADAECFGDVLMIIIPASLAVGEPPRKVTFVTTPAWNSVAGAGEIEALSPWDTETKVPEAELISGHPRVLDGTLPPEQVPNLVFIASGFTIDDQSAFENITNTLVHRLRTDPQLRPYPYVASAMNFWRIPIVAPEAGVSVRMEVYPFEKDGQLFALPLQKPEPPPEAGTWRLRHLLYVAGLPMPRDQVGQVTIDKIREHWALTLRPIFVPKLQDPAVVPNSVVEAWQRCAGRTFIDEVNNFPAVSVGGVPAIDAEDVGEFDYHPLRGGSLTFTDTGHQIEQQQSPERRAFFQRVAAKPKNGRALALGNTPDGIGYLWAELRNSFFFDHRVFVIDLCNMPTGQVPFGRSGWSGVKGLIIRPTLRVPSDIAIITNETTLPGLAVVKDPIRNALKLKLPALDSMELLAAAWQTVAHEIGHAFGLGDEYASTGTTRPAVGSFSSVDSSNLMAAGDVLKPDGVSVDVGRIKWNWHRIRAASLITGLINPRGGEVYEVPVAPNSGFRFKPGYPVLFRQRTHMKVFPDDLLTSGECKVESISQDGGTVVISRTLGDLDLSHTFLPGSILYAPVPAPADLLPFRPYLTLVSPLAERIMAATGGTLSGKICNLTDVKVYGAAVQSPVLPTSELDKYGPLNALPRIVGVYFGGTEYACGVVHPAGSCQMRNGFNAYTHFCHACQYALVDQIDPEQHGLVDGDHAKFYTL